MSANTPSPAIDNPYDNPDGRGDYHEMLIETPRTAEEIAQAYFEATHIIVSPTAEHQNWHIPGSESSIPAHTAREISLAAAHRPVGAMAMMTI